MFIFFLLIFITMKTTDTQIAIIESILDIVKSWRNTDSIDSFVLYNDIEESLNIDLEELLHPKQIECLKNELSKILDRIKRNE